KAVLESPWELFAQKHAPGETIEGVVTNVADFGAFVLVGEGIEGLIHTSEIRGMQGFEPQDVLASGDIVLARILRIEPERQRLALSQRRLSQHEEMEWIWQRGQSATTFNESQEQAELVYA
ncbi:MAG: S1 RNA-binding domain-containing protein, partial [Anaerolineales bacterium]|nr:S1 RNA-binding domain-containing protein [Anaerolineales bacterium]